MPNSDFFILEVHTKNSWMLYIHSFDCKSAIEHDGGV